MYSCFPLAVITSWWVARVMPHVDQPSVQDAPIRRSVVQVPAQHDMRELEALRRVDCRQHDLRRVLADVVLVPALTRIGHPSTRTFPGLNVRSGRAGGRPLGGSR